MQKRKEDTIRGMAQGRSQMDIAEVGEGEKADGLVGRWAGSEDFEGMEEVGGVG
jgi:hypothetical protein